MSRADIYGRVKAAAYEAAEAGMTVNQAAAHYGFKARSIRSTADRLGLKLARQNGKDLGKDGGAKRHAQPSHLSAFVGG
jgi:hypothetical protein